MHQDASWHQLTHSWVPYWLISGYLLTPTDTFLGTILTHFWVPPDANWHIPGYHTDTFLDTYRPSLASGGVRRYPGMSQHGTQEWVRIPPDTNWHIPGYHTDSFLGTYWHQLMHSWVPYWCISGYLLTLPKYILMHFWVPYWHISGYLRHCDGSTS